MKYKTWIALFEVKPLPNSKNIKEGNAFVNAIANSLNSKNAIIRYKKAFKENGWKIISYKDLEQYKTRTNKFQIDSSIKKLTINELKENEVRFGCFHTWKNN